MYVYLNHFVYNTKYNIVTLLQLKKPKLTAFLYSMNNLKTKEKIPFIIVSKRVKYLGTTKEVKGLYTESSGTLVHRWGFNIALPVPPRGIYRFNTALVKHPNTEIGKLILKLIQNLGTALVVQWLRLCFHCRELGFHPWSGNEDPHRLHGAAKNKNHELKVKGGAREGCG